MMDNDVDINLEELSKGLPGLSSRIGSYLSEAGGYCLQKNSHNPGSTLSIQGLFDKSCRIYWKYNVSDQIKNSYADEQEAVEFGACGIAISTIVKLTRYTVIKRSCKGTGFDYWLGEKESDLPFEGNARLEVSGIMRGTEEEIKKRIKIKIDQTKQSDHLSIPAIIAITEFSHPVCNLVQR